MTPQLALIACGTCNSWVAFFCRKTFLTREYKCCRRLYHFHDFSIEFVLLVRNCPVLGGSFFGQVKLKSVYSVINNTTEMPKFLWARCSTSNP